ncbi:MAG: N-methyl-L-tryptophan oxidase [Actinomycetota bacterium]|nr:N-methyl-L-tryptophan oxidase [Actinomycetota bacterium]
MSRLSDSRYDVLVVGGGAMGSAAAWQLARRGQSVLLLERFEAGHAYGASHGGVRIFRYGYDDPTYVRMVQQALPLWRELEADAGETLLELTGAVDHGPERDIAALAAAYRACGVNHEHLTPGAATERWPGLRFDSTVLTQADAGRTKAAATVAALHRMATAHGAELRWATKAHTIEAKEERVTVRTDDAEFAAPVAVVAVGAWSQPLLAPLGLPLPPMRVTEEQVFHFPPVEDRPGGNPWPSFMHRGPRIRYGLQTPGEGIKLGEHHSGPVCDPEPAQRSFAIDPTARDRIRRYAADWLPGVIPEPVTETTCLYTTTPNEDFVIDRFGPIVVAAGFSGHGFKFTPLIGARLADLALGVGQGQ